MYSERMHQFQSMLIERLSIVKYRSSSNLEFINKILTELWPFFLLRLCQMTNSKIILERVSNGLNRDQDRLAIYSIVESRSGSKLFAKIISRQQKYTYQFWVNVTLISDLVSNLDQSPLRAIVMLL